MGKRSSWWHGNLAQIVLISLPILALMVWQLLKVGGPAYRTDEIAYLGSAAAIAGKVNGLRGSWYTGYSFVLAPFFWLAPGVMEAWPAVLVVNGLAMLISGFGLWSSIQNCRLADRDRATWLILLSLLVFGSMAFLGWAFPNCLLMALIAIMVWILSLPGFGFGHAAAVGLIVGSATWVHPSAVVIVIAASLACTAGCKGPTPWRQGVVVLIIGLSMALAYGRVVHPWVMAPQSAGTSHYGQSIAEVAHRSHHFASVLAYLALGVVNGLATSAIASFGFAGSALAAILPGNNQPSAPGSLGLRRVLAFLLVAWGGLILLSAGLMLFDPRWLQHAFHQRYTQPLLAGLVVYGMALAPQHLSGRLLVWSFSATPILLSLLAALFVLPYDNRFNIIDQLAAVTFFLEPGVPANVPLMLSTGLVTTGAVQLLGLRAFIPLAAGLSMLGWQRLEWIQRMILYEGSRPPALARAVSALARDGLHPCVYVASTPATRDLGVRRFNERGRLMRYYLSGEPVRVFSSMQPIPRRCDLLVRPTDSEALSATRLGQTFLANCQTVIADTNFKYVLEDCRGKAASPKPLIETKFLSSRRDLISLTRVQTLQPRGFSVVGLFHSDELPPRQPRDYAWWQASPTSRSTVLRPRGSLIHYGPSVILSAGNYRAVYDELELTSGSVEMTVTADQGQRILAKRVLKPGSGLPVLPFRLNRSYKEVEVVLRVQEAGLMQSPGFLVIFGHPPNPASRWWLVGAKY